MTMLETKIEAQRTVRHVRSDKPQKPRGVTARRLEDIVPFVGGGLAALSLTALVFSHVLPFSGALGFLAVSFPLYVVMLVAVSALTEPAPIVRDRVASVSIHALAAIVMTALFFILGYTFYRGRKALVHANFFTQDLANAGPLQPITIGGVKHAIAGTLIEISLALLITVPLGILCAIFLTEFPGKLARFVRTIVEAMTALPSIVAGLFIYAALILGLGVQKSGLAAALAISVMMLPIIIRASDVVLRLVPASLKEASYALGAGRWATVRRVVLPTARSGLTTAVILGMARGVGETSPVLITAGYGAGLNVNPLEGPMVSLPLAAYQLVKAPEPVQIARGFGSACVLLLLVLVLFIVARVIGGRPAGVLSPRQQRRSARRSSRKAIAFAKREAEDLA